MILFEIFGREDHPTYQSLAIANLGRQYDFLRSIVIAAVDAQRLCLSQSIIRALNYHAIACLHTNAGEYRPTKVTVRGTYVPPEHYRIQALMDDFVNDVNRHWEQSDPVYLAAYILWKLNWIHPFINGNGRTARVTCYYVLCLKLGGWLSGEVLLPELIRRERLKPQEQDRYTAALIKADDSITTGTQLDLTDLHKLLSELLAEQMQSAQPDGNIETVSPQNAANIPSKSG